MSGIFILFIYLQIQSGFIYANNIKVKYLKIRTAC